MSFSPRYQTMPAARPQSAFGIPQPSTPSSSVFNAEQLPAFQPAPMGTRSVPLTRLPVHFKQEEFDLEEKYLGHPKDDDQKGIARVSVDHSMTFLGAFLLVLVALTPVWDACVLLSSRSNIYFMGGAQSFWTIMFCCAVITFFIVAMMLIERFGRAETKSSQTFLSVFTMAITILGLGLLIFAVPLRTSTQLAYDELISNCAGGPRTAPLSTKYNELLKMRTKPDCIKKTSIEECDGFQDLNISTAYLKHMELEYGCSGFCYSPGSHANTSKPLPPTKAVLTQGAAAASSTETAAVEGAKLNLVEALRRHHAAKNAEGLSLLSASQDLSTDVPSWEKLPKGVGDTSNNMVATGWMSEYPPTLFTNANFKTTCEGAAARELRFTALEAAYLMYLEGALLLVTSIIAGFLKLCTMCRTGEEMMDQRADMPLANGQGQFQFYSGPASQKQRASPMLVL
jgi:hypothetical protein